MTCNNYCDHTYVRDDEMSKICIKCKQRKGYTELLE